MQYINYIVGGILISVILFLIGLGVTELFKPTNKTSCKRKLTESPEKEAPLTAEFVQKSEFGLAVWYEDGEAM